MPADRHFFVLSLPRSRSAWLSALLTDGPSFCLHEGTAGHSDFATYVAALRGRPESAVGDSNPSLVFYIDELLAAFPDARFAVIRRDPDEAIKSFCVAAPASANALRATWPDFLKVFEDAVGKLPDHFTVDFEQLGAKEVCAGLVDHLTGEPMNESRWELLKNLRITSTFPAVDSLPLPPIPVAPPSLPNHGFDFTGLTARHFTDSDRERAAVWFRARHDRSMNDLPLPPLGVVVEDAAGPAGALWCFETYGTGVAWIEMPITRPGLTVKRASDVMAYAVSAIVAVAGQGYTPPARFTRFRVCSPPSFIRVLKRLGFVAPAVTRENLLLAV